MGFVPSFIEGEQIRGYSVVLALFGNELERHIG